MVEVPRVYLQYVDAAGLQLPAAGDVLLNV